MLAPCFVKRQKTSLMPDQPLGSNFSPRLGLKAPSIGMTGLYGVSLPAQEPTISHLKQRWLAKILERGARASRWAYTLQIAARRLDADEDGQLTHSQFQLLVKTTGNCFTPAEAYRLCSALDATNSGVVVIADLIDAMMQCEAKNANIFGSVNSKRDKTDFPPSPGHTNRSNLPSLPGGILKGGAFEIDCDGQQPWRGGKNVSPEADAVNVGQSVNVSGNTGNYSSKPSVQGGIFGQHFAEAFAIKPAVKHTNHPSQLGGIFRAPSAGCRTRPVQRFNSNRPSVPGGIFAA